MIESIASNNFRSRIKLLSNNNPQIVSTRKILSVGSLANEGAIEINNARCVVIGKKLRLYRLARCTRQLLGLVLVFERLDTCF